MATYDLLQPIGDDNREEHILVEYEGFIHSSAEELIIAMISQHDLFLDDFPLLKDYLYLTPDELYIRVMYYEAEQLLDTITEHQFTPEEIVSATTNLINHEEQQIALHDTYINEALVNLSEKDFVKSISFIKHREYTNYELNYIADNYRDNFSKLTINEGSLVGFYMDHPEITTVFLGDPDDLKYLIENADKKHLQNTMFILRNNIDTLDLLSDDSSVLVYKNTDFYEETMKNKITWIEHANVDPIPKPLPDSTNEPGEG